mmetsp:Transcript_4276/g.12113  ORF Transcript_4276/g.12113 Transcript_4276/m.12113 type:complete len:248 (-) Transcript_4276:763-1506(-)
MFEQLCELFRDMLVAWCCHLWDCLRRHLPDGFICVLQAFDGGSDCASLVCACDLSQHMHSCTPDSGIDITALEEFGDCNSGARVTFGGDHCQRFRCTLDHTIHGILKAPDDCSDGASITASEFTECAHGCQSDQEGFVQNTFNEGCDRALIACISDVRDGVHRFVSHADTLVVGSCDGSFHGRQVSPRGHLTKRVHRSMTDNAFPVVERSFDRKKCMLVFLFRHVRNRMQRCLPDTRMQIVEKLESG